MKNYIHPLTEERVPINKALLAEVIEHLNTMPEYINTYVQERCKLIYKLEEILEEDERT